MFAHILAGAMCLLLGGDGSTVDFSFRTADGYEFDARIDLPRNHKKPMVGVLLLGGGYGNDLDWTVPGRYTLSG